ncbi:hypothetical protein AB0420_24260 [Streptomyces caelestis]|uniref:Uncharacterized protein n=1 Tax=Streptomyces heliomycini TaxID=284032 RepID=A0ABV5LAK0_9ACTN|nr:hypothetical protein [Streptomyces sp. XY152]KOV34639.1 hypothetical protein ADK58_04350 [Streptomyces sp. XY152]
MAANKKTTVRPGKKKVPKNERAHRPCPHCGQIQQGKGHAEAPHRPGGLKRRKEKRQQSAEQPAAAQLQAVPEPPEPIDAKTIIQGVVERIPAALADANAGETPTPTALNVAVRKAVLDEFRTRTQFAGRLAEIDALVWAQAAHGGELLGGAMREHLRSLGILRVTEPEESDRFVVTEGEGGTFEVLRPAYVDEVTGKVILSGHLRRVSGSATGEEE